MVMRIEVDDHILSFYPRIKVLSYKDPLGKFTEKIDSFHIFTKAQQKGPFNIHKVHGKNMIIIKSKNLYSIFLYGKDVPNENDQ